MTDNLPIKNDLTFAALEKLGAFEITEYTENIDLSDERRYKKLDMNSVDKSAWNMLISQLPGFTSAMTLSHCYRAVFPAGLPHTLIKLKQSGYGGMVKGFEGKFAGAASLYPLQAQAALTSIFSVMSVAVGQHYLTEISGELKLINMKMDKILDFLYGDKKAELIAEIDFLRYAYNNYISVMANEPQRLATITNLQCTKKVAMKNIEFYISDLEATEQAEAKNYDSFTEIANKVFQIKESLDMAVQLLVMGSLMEVYYSQNYDSKYLKSVKDETLWFIERYNTRLISTLNRLNGRNDGYSKPNALNKLIKIDTAPLGARIAELIGMINIGEGSPLRKLVTASIDNISSATEYYIDSNYSVYMPVNP